MLSEYGQHVDEFCRCIEAFKQLIIREGIRKRYNVQVIDLMAVYIKVLRFGQVPDQRASDVLIFFSLFIVFTEVKVQRTVYRIQVDQYG
jgi:hypothetical protein